MIAKHTFMFSREEISYGALQKLIEACKNDGYVIVEDTVSVSFTKSYIHRLNKGGDDDEQRIVNNVYSS